MRMTAEIRWFWDDEPSPVVEGWFCDASRHSTRAAREAGRVDEYLLDGTSEDLSVKRRAGRPGVEIKGRVSARCGVLMAPPFCGPLELWCKWDGAHLAAGNGRVLRVEKQRRLRMFDTTGAWPQEIATDEQTGSIGENAVPPRGCTVEWTRLRHADGASSWTFAFEAFGAMHTVQQDLNAVALLLSSRRPPPLRGALLASYANWIERRGQRVSPTPTSTPAPSLHRRAPGP